MKRVTITHSSGRSISVSPAQARAYVAKGGWRYADNFTAGGPVSNSDTTTTVVGPHESVVPATEIYERSTDRFPADDDSSGDES